MDGLAGMVMVRYKQGWDKQEVRREGRAGNVKAIMDGLHRMQRTNTNKVRRHRSGAQVGHRWGTGGAQMGHRI